MILYEYPLNEGIRTMLRLEHLFDRLGLLVSRDDPVDHHFALATLFEIIDVSARADLKSDLLKELVKDADVLIESFRPGTFERWGLGPDVLHAINPRLVMVRCSGYGQTGPYAPRPGFGTVAE